MTLDAIATTDFKGLNLLKADATHDAKKALPAVAKQFEAIFLQSMLKSMRMAESFLDKDSPFKSKNMDMFQEMLDGQYASNIANNNGIGLARMLTQQLDRTAASTKSSPFAIGQIQVPTDLLKTPFKENNENKVVNALDKALVKQNNTNNQEVIPSTIDEFVQSIWPLAKEAAAIIGLDPKVLVAQAALETGWGKSMAKDSDGSTSNNLFNVKSGNNSDFASVRVNTTEFIANTPIKVSDTFRKYPSIEASFKDYVSLIKGSDRYQNALAKATNPELYVDELSRAGYATDPHYSSKIMSIYRGDELNEAVKRCDLTDSF